MMFPANFVWGAGTSAYQVEGAWNENRKSPSIWDRFSQQAGNVWEDHNGNVACDHYYRYKEDVALMARLKLQAYNFSVSWARVLANGNGSVNKAGLDFYDRLVDELLAAGIEPWITLYHWDLPYHLHLRGGWLNPEMPGWFAKFTAAVVNKLSDRVTNWSTINELQTFIGMGYQTGEHAPGGKCSLKELLLIAHHALLAHGRAVETIRARARRQPSVGWSPGVVSYYPLDDTPECVDAARRATFSVSPGGLWNNRWFSDAALFGQYPEDGLKAYGSAVPKFTKADLQIIHQPLDFYGCNIFAANPIKADANGNPVIVNLPPGHPHTDYFWRWTPAAMYWTPRFLHEHVRLPLVIMENGMSSASDCPCFDGHVHDANRVEFISRHLLELRRALRDGVAVRGYFHWSLMDNFEWHQGYRHRFGLVHVDYQTQQRTLKDSAYWYQEIITSNGAALDKLITIPPLPYIIKETMRYVEANLKRPFNIKNIAAHLRCHPDFLSRKFKKHTGLDLSSHIRQKRIDYAKELLKNPKIIIDDAADKCGFGDRVYFTKVFHRLTGQTPGHYQRQFRPTATTTPLKPKVLRSMRG
ncbi:MAG: beta-glucosidase [Verrucomicrobiales bacterium]|jgi:beta-glucosidase|nr:beta-glucosidase [Verrucomicrobiales bacterium]